jgi:transcriptional regulator with XRE-family HTH domain
MKAFSTIKPIVKISQEEISKFKQIRKSKNLSQTEIAKLIGISRSLYSYFENGRINYNEDLLKRFYLVVDQK